MSVTALYTIAMNPTQAFEYTRGALSAAGAALGMQSPPALIEFSLTRKDAETGSIDIVMPGRAAIAAAGDGKSTVTVSIEPATQFLLYAGGIALVALLFGNWFLGGFGGLWFLIVLGAAAYAVWALFNKWPNEALAAIHAKMRASDGVSGGETIARAPVFTPPSASPPAASAASIAEQIRHLAELRDQGHITQQEFDAKKAELLKRI